MHLSNELFNFNMDSWWQIRLFLSRFCSLQMPLVLVFFIYQISRSFWAFSYFRDDWIIFSQIVSDFSYPCSPQISQLRQFMGKFMLSSTVKLDYSQFKMGSNTLVEGYFLLLLFILFMFILFLLFLLALKTGTADCSYYSGDYSCYLLPLLCLFFSILNKKWNESIQVDFRYLFSYGHS